MNQPQNDLDQEFISEMLQIEQNYGGLNKHQRIRIELWTKKLCQVTTNDVWKKNRNLYAKILLHQVIRNELSEPFDKRPLEGPLPKLNKYQNYIPQSIKENKRNILTARGSQENVQNSKTYVNSKISNEFESSSYSKQQEQLNEQQGSIELQQNQIQQLSIFNEKLVRSVISCRQYLDLLNDPMAEELKLEQDELFSWMHEQSQQLLMNQQQSFEQEQVKQDQENKNRLEQIDEQEEDNDFLYGPGSYDSTSNEKNTVDLMTYLEKFEQKGEDLKKTSQYILQKKMGQNKRYPFPV